MRRTFLIGEKAGVRAMLPHPIDEPELVLELETSAIVAYVEEIATAGHDRCIIPIKPENIDAWLNPDPIKLSDLHAILDDLEHPYCEHRMAA